MPLYIWIIETPVATEAVAFRSELPADFLLTLSENHCGSVLRIFFPELDPDVADAVVARRAGYYFLLRQAADPDLDDKLRPLLMKARLTA